MDISIHLSAGEVVLILIVYAIVAPFIKAATDDLVAWLKRSKKL